MHDEKEEMNGGLVCLSLILVTAVGAIAGGTVVLTLATYVGEGPEPIEVVVGVEPGHAYDEGYEEDYKGTYEETDGYGEEVWTIGNGYYDSGTEYLDEESGQIKGFHIDVVEEVCQIANKNCKLIRDRYSNSWSGGLGGHGLLSGWYDAAQGWAITYPRVRTFHFTEPFTKAVPAVFVVARGNPTGFDWQDLTGRKIVFAQGWFSDSTCLARYADTVQGLPLNPDDIADMPIDSIVNAVNGGQFDAAFIPRDLISISDELEQVGPYLDRCTLGGGAMMTRKDSHFTSWWNPAWRSLLTSRRYEELCDRIDYVHNLFGDSSEKLCLTR